METAAEVSARLTWVAANRSGGATAEQLAELRARWHEERARRLLAELDLNDAARHRLAAALLVES